MVNRIGVVLGVCVALALAVYQMANMCALREVAAAGSPFTLISTSDSISVVHGLTDRIHTNLEQRFLATIALSHLEHSVDSIDLTRVQRSVDALPHTADDEALRARLAMLYGDRQTAFTIALNAHQMNIVNEQITSVVLHGDIARAIDLQHTVIGTLDGQPTQREALADAYWRLGALENLAEQQHKSGDHLRNARDAFEKNVLLTPFSGRALLSAGYAELALGNTVKSKQRFSQALASDPSSASAEVGLARVAIATHDRAEAQRTFTAAHRLAPQQDDVLRLARDIAR